MLLRSHDPVAALTAIYFLIPFQNPFFRFLFQSEHLLFYLSLVRNRITLS
jgi:hypothetical protein